MSRDFGKEVAAEEVWRVEVPRWFVLNTVLVAIALTSPGWPRGRMDGLHGSQVKGASSVTCHLYRTAGGLEVPSTEVQLLTSVSSPPRLSIQPSGLSLDPALETQAFAVLPNSSLVPLFLVHMVSWVGTQIQA